jgi:hypothetical protein
MNIHLILAGVFSLAGVGFVLLFLWMKRVMPEREKVARDMMFFSSGMFTAIVLWEIIPVVMPIMEAKQVVWGYNAWDVYAVGTFTLVLVGGVYSLWKRKTPFRKLSIGFLTALAVCLVCYLVVSHNDHALNDESHRYADTAITAIISSWDSKELESRTSPEFMSAMKDGNLETAFALWRKLGRLRGYKGCQGEVNDSAIVDKAKAIVAVYTADVEFEAGHAEIKATCIKHGSQWQILGFRVNSTAFSAQPQ